MFKQVNVDILGIVENMSGYVVQGTVEGCPAGTPIQFETGTGTQTATVGENGSFETVMNVFGEGGADRLAQKHGFPVLGRVPLNPAVRVGGDAGDPVTVAQPDSALAAAFDEIAGRFAQRVAIRSMQSLPILQ